MRLLVPPWPLPHTSPANGRQLHWVSIRLLDIRVRKTSQVPLGPPQHRLLLFIESGRSQPPLGPNSPAYTRQPKQRPTKASPAGLLALEILTGGKLHLLRFGRSDNEPHPGHQF